MSVLKPFNMLFRLIWAGDAVFSSTMFEIWDAMKRGGSAYASFLHAHFSLRRPAHIAVGLIDDAFTFGTIAAFLLLAYALPPFSGTGDWWNRGREYAVTFTDEKGDIIGRRGIRQDDAIALDDLSPHLIKAVLATEDARFFDHFGVDVIGTLRAMMRNAQSEGSTQGGSSISQQVAKNLFLSPEKTLRRKVHEAFLSMWIEARLEKDEILKLYLDRSYLGGGAYGVEAASQFYFGKSARDLDITESAMIAGLFKAPTTYAPHQNPEASLARTNVVLYRMLDAGFITEGELLQARRDPPVISVPNDALAPDWFLDWAYDDTLRILNEKRLTSEFIVEVKTTIDRDLQIQAQKILNETLDVEGVDGKFSQAASVTMSPDGAVRAIVGGRDYEVSQFNRATSAKRQSGSAFKPFVYLAALLDGFEPDQIVVDGPVSIGNWSPKNYSGNFAGRTTLKNALAHSYNSIPVKLSIAIAGGRKRIAKVTHDVGVKGEIETWPPMVLGTSALTLIDLTTGYATFAGGGKLAEPYAVLEIKRPTGDIIYNRNTNAEAQKQVVPESVIADLNAMMAAVVKNGTARKADLLTTPQAGKTGTNQGYRDAWFVGFTAHTVTGVWVGNDDFSPMNEITGGKIPAPMWKRITEVADRGLAPKSLAGIPLDDTFQKVAAVDLRPAVVPEIEERPDQSEELAVQPTDEVEDVLNGMFRLFEKPEVANKRKRVPVKKIVGTKVVGDAVIKLPKANADKAERDTFLETLFKKSNDAKPKKKKKTLFDF